MESEEILSFVRRNSGRITLVHLFDEFEYMNRQSVLATVENLIKEGSVIVKEGAFMRHKGTDYMFLTANESDN